MTQGAGGSVGIHHDKLLSNTNYLYFVILRFKNHNHIQLLFKKIICIYMYNSFNDLYSYEKYGTIFL